MADLDQGPDGLDYLELRMTDYLDQVAAATPAPGAGAVSATVVALAAGLAAMAAGLSHRQLSDAGQLADRMRSSQERAKPLAHRDAAVYAEVLEALRRQHDDPTRSAAVTDALARAAEVPLEIAGIGVTVLDVAADVARRGNPNLKGDALTACLMAQAAVAAATALVELNLPDATDPRRVRAAALAYAARNAAVPPVATSSVSPT